MYKLTERAAEDFAGIYDYTLLKFGETQAGHYTDVLETFFETLAGMPDMGRDIDQVLYHISNRSEDKRPFPYPA